jgi:hypothetical protein
MQIHENKLVHKSHMVPIRAEIQTQKQQEASQLSW